MKSLEYTAKNITTQALMYTWIALGAFLAAFALEVFLVPNNLIDGGVVGMAMILSHLFGRNYLPYFQILLTLPFFYLAYRYIGKIFLLHMSFATVIFVASIAIIQGLPAMHFIGESLEVVVIGGAILGIGCGLIIRYGGCLDGTEILGIIINRRTGITVGQVVLFFDIFIFSAAGFVFNDWHTPLLSLIMFMVVTKVMDAVIVGLEETKSVLIISPKSRAISEAIITELGLGLTIMYGRGGYSGEDREILYVISERLQLSELKELIHRVDPTAFIAIENLHEVSSGLEGNMLKGRKKKMESLMNRILKKE